MLKRIFGEGWLVTNRETALLNTHNELATGKSFWLDLTDFEGKLKVCEAHNHPPTVICPDCLPAFEEAVELYQDDFMAGFSLKDCPAYDEWQFFQREELRTQLTNALVRLSAHYANALEYESAITYARRWLALDPLHEEAHRQLMSLFWQSGQRNAALRQYEICQKVLFDELGVEPSEETKELYQKIQAIALVTATTLRPKSNLPGQSTSFIGRVSELAEIRAKLKQDDCRLLTLLGPGGSGKTRLAIEAAGGLMEDFKHGIFFVNLAPLEGAERIPSTIASTLNFSFYEEGTPEEQLLDYLGNKHMLLILDNFEHLLAGVNFVNQMIFAAPEVKILATSRISLAITGEQIYSVMGMAYPQSPETVEVVSKEYSAIKLFEAGAQRRQAGFELSDENFPDVIRICALVEGIPLGIVLAASWMMMLTPKEIAAEIVRDMAFLETELQDLPQRQRSLLSVFNHSWKLLSENERKIMAALSVFRGGFTQEAAQEVVNASLSDLRKLSHKSFLHRTSSGRYELHELLRQYAAEELGNDPAVEAAIRDKHSEFFCLVLANWESELEGARQGVAQAEMEVDVDNIRTAWMWGVEKAGLGSILNAINALCHFYNGHYQRVEAEKLCRSLLEKLDELQTTAKHEPISQHEDKNSFFDIHKLRIRTFAWCGYFNWLLGNLKIARELSEHGLVLLDKEKLSSQDLRFEKGFCLYNLANILKFESLEESTKFAKESVESFKSIHKYWWVGFALLALGEFTSINHKIKCYEESLAVSRKQGNLVGIAAALLHLSAIASYQWEFGKAEQMVAEALEIYKEIPLRTGIVNTYRLLGSFLVWQGKFIQARSIVREMLQINLEIGSKHTVALANAIAGYPDLLMGEYEAAYKQAMYGLTLCRKEKHRAAIWGVIYAISILGRVAQAQEDYKEAEAWFRECIPIYQELGQQDNISQDLASLGLIDRVRGKISQAQRYLVDGLQISIEAEGFLALVHTIPGIALLFADQGEVERAVELYTLAATLGYVANSKWFDDIAGDEIARAAEGLPMEVVKAAKARGRGLDLWETAMELLAELKEMGWDADAPGDEVDGPSTNQEHETTNSPG